MEYNVENVSLPSFRIANVSLPSFRIANEDIVFEDSGGNKIFPIENSLSNTVKIEKINSEIYHLTLSIIPEKVYNLRYLEICMHFLPDSIGIWNEVKNSFHWVPNLKQYDKRIISQHVFRSPAMILTYNKRALSIMPDLDLLTKFQAAPYYLDIKYSANGITLKYGMSNYVVKRHQYYEKSKSVFRLHEKLEMGMYFICLDNSSPLDGIKIQEAEWGDTIKLKTRKLINSGKIEIRADQNGKAARAILLDGKDSNFILK